MSSLGHNELTHCLLRDGDFKFVNFKHNLNIQITLEWMPEDLFGGKSSIDSGNSLVPSGNKPYYYLSHCGPRSMSDCRHMAASLGHSELTHCDLELPYIYIYGLVNFLAATKQLYKWYVPSVRPSVCLSHLFDYVPIIVSSWNFQELLPMTKVRSKVRGQRSRSQRSQPNLTVSGL